MAAFVVHPDETAFDFLSRLRQRPVHVGIDGIGSLLPGEVVELTGPPGACSIVLAHAAAHLALGEALGGVVTNVLYVVSGGRPPLQRMVATLKRLVAADADPSAALAAALRRVKVVSCEGVVELLATVARLRVDLAEAGAPAGDTQTAVIIDGLGSGYWLDRLEHAAGYDKVNAVLADLLAHRRVVALVGVTTIADVRVGLGAAARFARHRGTVAADGTVQSWTLATARTPGDGPDDGPAGR